MGTETRKATINGRMYPETRTRLRRWAAAHGIDMAEALEQLVPKKRLKEGFDVCRNCDKFTKNPRGMHDGHESWCVLFAAGVVTGR